MKSKLSLGLLVVSLLLLSTTISFADQCVVLGKAQVETAKFFYLKNGATMYHYCKPCGDAAARAEVINSVRFKQSGDEWEIAVNEEIIDVAYVYVLFKNRYHNLANLVGCSTTDVPLYLHPDYLPSEAKQKLSETYVPSDTEVSKALHVYVEPFKRHGDRAPSKDTLEIVYGLFYLFLRETFIFPGFDINFRYCKEKSGYQAYFDPSSSSIVICNEYHAKLLNQNLDRALPWTFFHEVGHALLFYWDDPLYSNEDVADEFATVISLMMGEEGKKIISEAVNEWKTHPSFFESLAKIFINDRHTVSIQRARNISAWVSNSENLKRQWFKKLAPHMQTKALKSMINKPESWMDTDLIEKELKRR